MDFGVARLEGDPSLTTSRFFFGSPLYAAPELVDPRSIDHRADLYSLGILLFEMLEGAPPFVNESVFRLLEMHQQAPLPPFTRPLPSEFAAMVGRLCSKDREDRYPSAQAVLVDLKRQLFRADPELATSDAGGLDEQLPPLA
jgi:serine/threonine-protein kinase